MSDVDPSIPLSLQAPPRVDRGESPAYPLGAELVQQTRMMAAVMAPGIMEQATKEMTYADVAGIAAGLAMGICNEVNTYRLKDNRIVKIEDDHGE